VRVIDFVLGAIILFIALSDAVGTLVTTRVRRGRGWPTNFFYRHSWAAWRRIGLKMRDDDHRERTFTAYGPVSLLIMLMIWVSLEIIGWSLIWYGLREGFNDLHTWLDALYFSGVNFLTVGFGDILAVHGGARILVVIAAFSGVTTIALVVGYLPTLYGAYSAREQQLLLLDDLSGTYVTSMGLIEAHAPDGDLAPLYAMFSDWEQWAAGVMESHTAYRMLVLFRSRRTGQSWLTALGIMTDTAVTVLACIRGAGLREPLLYYRRATELVAGLIRYERFDPRDTPSLPDIMNEDDFRRRYARLTELGFSMRPYDAAWSAMQQLRGAYVPQLGLLFGLLLPPMTFRNPSVLYPEILEQLAAERSRPEES
jgi:hypothetical protein